MNVPEQYRTKEWRYRLDRDWSTVPNWNRPYDLREEEQAKDSENQDDLTFPAAAMIAVAENA